MKKRLIVATGNMGKLREIKAILTDFEVLSAGEAGLLANAEETGKTFAQNAEIKADDLKPQTNCAVLADDSGLCVDALDGAPGIYSARYAGENATDDKNIDKLLAALEGVPKEARDAHFACAMCLILENGKKIFGVGTCPGRILEKRSGTGGFGYDPVFFSTECGKSFGDLSDAEKNEISHRRRALEDLKQKLK